MANGWHMDDYQTQINSNGIVFHSERLQRLRSSETFPAFDDDAPPDDFTNITIFPDTEEINTSIEPFLRANKTKGKYRDLQHYLDVHARLMKEDYVAPIREGLKEYRDAEENKRKPKENELRFYYDVKLVSIECDHAGFTHFVSFDTSKFKNFDWELSKRLNFGSLLVFSKDNFKTIIFATVADSNVTMLKRGIIQVVFQNNLEVVFTSSSEDDTFIMAETTAYFEAYRHVLEGLIETTALPFQKYILYCKNKILPPKYLKDISKYDIASIMSDTSDELSVSVLEDSDWPETSETTLNDSQLKALKQALTKEFAIIQGPPGTGKTYIGLKIMDILLQNESNIVCEGPILVVSYTNHALDQFMEGILDFCPEGLIRVGGRSKSDKLADFNLKVLRKKTKENNYKSSKKDMEFIGSAADELWQESIRLETTILKVEDLADEISAAHRNSLNEPNRTEGIVCEVMEIWLKASNANIDNHLLKVSRSYLAGIIGEGAETRIDTELKYSTQMSFQDRVKIYRFWLYKYKEDLTTRIDHLKSISPDNPESEPFQLLLCKANDDILPDNVLKPYIADEIYAIIQSIVQKENKKVDNENSYLRFWLLEMFDTTDLFLDAIEQLQVIEREDNKEVGVSKVPVANTTNERSWVITESDDSDSENSVDSYDTSELEANLLKDIKDIEFNFTSIQNRNIQLLKRAKVLGVHLSNTEEKMEDKMCVNNMSYPQVFNLLNKSVPYTEEEVSAITDLWALPLDDRYRLYKYWTVNKKRKIAEQLLTYAEAYRVMVESKKNDLQRKDINILKKAKVIGMTTSGAARNRKVLRKVGCPIIIVEEAAEILEAHIVTTLNSRCKHLILIGDHQQLRPRPKMHKLAKDYNLEISLFERLVANRVSLVTLIEQHRMRPEISRFIKHVYPHLKDHESVQNYEDVRGVKSNVFFIQHSYEESVVEDSTSKSNVHEARFLTALCKYFLQQGYQGRQITILAGYLDQVTCIKNEMKPEESLYECVTVTSIDNYQGEENDIILLSLVRSNQGKEVGFLKTKNRVCVALSRAKIGMFVIGNLELLAEKVHLWKTISETAKEQQVIGRNLELVCVNHPDHVTIVSQPEDFQKEVPEGGCNRKCEAKLPCGHACPRMCHAINGLHNEVKSSNLCLKTCQEENRCSSPCLNSYYYVCEQPMLKTLPMCGHEATMPCFKDVGDVVCSENCGQKMACGHICRGQCGKCSAEAQHQPCLEKVDKTWSPCQHSKSVECHTDTSVDPCPKECDARLECGHKCKGTCGGCLSGRVHKSCGEKCNKILPCGHLCTGPCGGQCVPCSSRCLTACRHGPCSKTTCGEKCDTCIENCAMICQHHHCTLRCVDGCLEPLCIERCNKRVASCKHKCVSLCGELCVCYDCEKDKFSLTDSSNKKKHKQVKKIEMIERMKKFQVDEDTILMKIPECGHIFTLNQLDKWVEDFEPDTTHYIRCPNCTVPIQSIARYEAKNKQRAERRENLKEYLSKSACTSHAEIENLIHCKTCLKNYCTVDEGEFLTRKPNQIDCNHALALTVQIKFSYVLLKLYELHKMFSVNNLEFEINKWKLAISSIQRNVTDQFYREMTLELHRLLLLEQIYILKGFLGNINCNSPSGMTTKIKTIKKSKLTSESREENQTFIDDLYKRFDHLEPGNEYLEKVEKLQSYSKDVRKVLDMSKTQDLRSALQNE
ncbi:NFX1-type zinc finger-containing protein 1-like [Physella acuta]|uniref:NFX1-type zinc finger-containing protein 1-like n=1 Tax=Physella acuta TaxID=109671 RepID=UPI0027DC707D|nr:NFX1-type zinc finger-containing protein 1-like [Physella acuta]